MIKPEPSDAHDLPKTEASVSALLAYQQKGVELLDGPLTRVLTVEKSRRIGYTWGVLAPYAVLKASRGKADRGSDVMYISYNQEMTREFIDACADWARAFSQAAIQSDEFLFDDTDPAHPEETRQIKAFRIKFASGFEIIALSGAPRNLRGKQGVVMIDEAAFVDNLKELLKSALAFLMWGGQVVVVSTHNGVDNPFNQLVQDVLSKRKPYTHVRVDLDDALRDGLYRRICLVSGQSWSKDGEDRWRSEIIASYGDGAEEELFCIPNASSGAWLPSTLIEARSKADIPVVRSALSENYLHLSTDAQRLETLDIKLQISRLLKSLNPERRHCLGFDFARYSDLSVIWVFEVLASTERRTAFVVELRRWPYKEQQDLCVKILKGLPRLIAGCFDGTGAGLGLAEGVQREMGMTGVHIEMFSVQWYRENMPAVKRAFEEGTIIIPRDDDIHSDFRLIEVKDGVPGVPAVRKGTTGLKRHGDAAIAAVLAWKASNSPTPGLIDYLRQLAEAQANKEADHGRK